MVELEDRIQFSDVVQPICLPMKGRVPEDGKILTVSSWGRKDAFHKGDILIREIPMRTDASCKQRPWADRMPTDVEDYLCAKALNPRDFRTLRTCHGDSGSGMEDVHIRRVHLSSFVKNSGILTFNTTHNVTRKTALNGETSSYRQILHSPLAVPQLEFMRSWLNKEKRQRSKRNIKTKKDLITSINDKIISSVSSDDSLKIGMVIKPSREEGDQKELIGITSYGSRQCASNELARFTRVSNYLGKICSLTGLCYPLN